LTVTVTGLDVEEQVPKTTTTSYEPVVVAE